ncbi:aspartate/glutamate racemase family protein [Allopusillimonas ginsengisoli]|uniref:aspartate/glutamate racemase family protein n=1 Tax=Allopusillimonas ginsengisoli TaxID=453575 RepID=UPI001020FE3B|nr:amino acid racemase [Allopusillimonas ginsengisoli]TEA79778.1 aspartate/glutamate racemase family protein [Allopusillimonas ginsengisoli]
MNDTQFEGRFLGVLGGMGPMAGAVFMQRLVALTDSPSDQQHVPAILWNDPRVPDRPAGFAGSGPDPLPWMKNGVSKLVRAGAAALVIPCNTAHLWYEQLAASTQVPILHIVQAVVDDLRSQGITTGRIGLLGTATTLKLGLYQNALQAHGYEPVLLPDHLIEGPCAASIKLVKNNRFADALEPATCCVTALRRLEVNAVVLGCTELPLALPHHHRAALDVVLTDSIDSLARAALRWYRSGQT